MRESRELSAMPEKPRLWQRLLRWGLQRYFLLTRAMTLGVKAVVLDGQGRIFLVRHTYINGWHLPGGGVELGETVVDALNKELAEEGNIVLEGPAQLHGVYYNRVVSSRDHVIVFVVRAFRQTAPRGADFELSETGFFSLDALPEGVTQATRARIDEVLTGSRPSASWSA
jgi:ADP-ribose pyrophosphatase YjhB (NUDIX family)